MSKFRSYLKALRLQVFKIVSLMAFYLTAMINDFQALDVSADTFTAYHTSLMCILTALIPLLNPLQWRLGYFS